MPKHHLSICFSNERLRASIHSNGRDCRAVDYRPLAVAESFKSHEARENFRH